MRIAHFLKEINEQKAVRISANVALLHTAKYQFPFLPRLSDWQCICFIAQQLESLPIIG